MRMKRCKCIRCDEQAVVTLDGIQMCAEHASFYVDDFEAVEPITNSEVK